MTARLASVAFRCKRPSPDSGWKGLRAPCDDDRLLLGRARSDEVADHNEPIAIPSLTRIKLWHRLDESKPSSNSELGIILVRRRVAEIRQHTLAHGLSNNRAIIKLLGSSG
jgi:hypothetical protein